MKSSTTLGLSLLAGAALIETALVPGLLIGGAVVLAPKVLLKFVPKGQRRRSSNTTASKSASSSASKLVVPVIATQQAQEIKRPARLAPSFAVKQAIFKTITFRMVATTVDFTANIFVIGDFATAAGLSAFGLVLHRFIILVMRSSGISSLRPARASMSSC